MSHDVIVINREDASRACARAIKDMQIPEDDVEFYAVMMMELIVFSSMVVSKLFEEEKEDE